MTLPKAQTNHKQRETMLHQGGIRVVSLTGTPASKRTDNHIPFIFC